jgi:hypothetical protein
MTEKNITELWRAEWLAYKSMAEEAFERYVIKSNDLVRQLALAGIAVVWIFRETTAAGAVNLSAQIRWAAILFVLCLALDLAHFLYGTYRTSGRLNKIRREENAAISKGIPWPEAPNGPPPELPQFGVQVVFALKTCALLIGAGLLLHYLAFRL